MLITSSGFNPSNVTYDAENSSFNFCLDHSPNQIVELSTRFPNNADQDVSLSDFRSKSC